MSTATADLGVLLLADARLPTGGHTQSGGLEPALLAGLPEADVPAYLRTRLRTATTVDAATAVVALHALRTGEPLERVTDAWAARTPSEVVRAAAIEVGRGYLRLLARLDGGSQPRATEHRPRPVAVALLAHHLGIDPPALARLICHDDLQTVGAAALKLVPLDPAEPVTWTLQLAAEVDDVVRRVAELTEPDDIPAPAAPALELWQHAHHHAPRRLFRA
ncbi:urease accessory protein UreF [Luteipulveratus halotolerans]|uniref:urease accessory protein UreF n=1 Tax=Luteipulveratus halotolerans TaxID=1631356 RepID=UPI00068044F2|nr:urease accessory UreF family protein [Luteipulveratus halotolerans]